MDILKKILIIDNEEIVLNLLLKKLLEQGYEVKISRNDKDGLLMMEKEAPDLVLAGFDVVFEMKQRQVLKNVPVIIIFNSGQPLEIDKAMALGVSDWVTKTEFDLNEIIQKVNKILRIKNL